MGSKKEEEEQTHLGCVINWNLENGMLLEGQRLLISETSPVSKVIVGIMIHALLKRFLGNLQSQWTDEEEWR